MTTPDPRRQSPRDPADGVAPDPRRTNSRVPADAVASDPLHAELRCLADVVAPVDLYERSLRRSRRIGRREAAVGTGAALVALGLLGSGLWQLPSAAPEAARSSAAAPAGSPAPLPAIPPPSASADREPRPEPTRNVRPQRPRPPVSASAQARSTSLAALPGQAFYAEAGRLVRLDREGEPDTVLSAPHSTVGVSSDGSRIAYVTGGTLMVVETGGGDPRQVYAGTASAEQAPVWSPNGDRLLIDAADPGVLDVATGRLTPLPSGLDGQHYRWSGDGSTLVYATGDCGLAVAEPDAQSGTPVPEQSATTGAAACRPVSVDATGDLVTVQLAPPASAAPDEAPADAVLDTVTGDIVDLPVTGKIIGAVFDAEGKLLVRSVRDGKTRLWLFAPDFTLLMRAREPAALSDLDLIAYTR
jgi:TolB protein